MGRVRCEPGWRLDWRSGPPLPDCDLWLVWSGKGEMRLRDRVVPLRPGVCFWVRPAGRYQATQDLHDRLGVTFIHFDVLDARGRPLRKESELPDEVYDLPDLAYADAVSRRVVELMSAGRGAKRKAAEDGFRTATSLLTGLLMDMDRYADEAQAGDLRPTQRHHHKVVMQIASRITESPAEVVPVAQLAAHAGYSPDHFARVFASVLGRGPQQFIVQARIDRARQLLAESGLSVGQISDALGYESLFFFCRQFKQKTGLTPSQYRRSRSRDAS